MAKPSPEPSPLRVGFVPEHFSTPIHYAQRHFGLSIKSVPFPTGTGAMIAALRGGDIDVGIGLTEGWVAGLGKKPGETEPGSGYSIVGTYVESPLTWAVSTGAELAGVKGLDVLEGGKLGVSRLGSGSHVMGYVLAAREGWLAPNQAPFSVVPLGDFASLRAAVSDGRADAFMWEWFTSKRYFPPASASDHPIRPLGTIPTPWPSWMIACTPALLSGAEEEQKVDARLEALFAALDKGVGHFKENVGESVEYISTELDYSVEDAQEWMKTIDFAARTRGVRTEVLEKVVALLNEAEVLAEIDAKKAAKRMAGLGTS